MYCDFAIACILENIQSSVIRRRKGATYDANVNRKLRTVKVLSLSTEYKRKKENQGRKLKGSSLGNIRLEYKAKLLPYNPYSWNDSISGADCGP
jgi:hypothetical protein